MTCVVLRRLENPVPFDLCFTKCLYLMSNTCFSIPFQDPNADSLKVLKTSEEYNWLHRRKVKCFYSPIISPDFRVGVQSFMQVSNLSYALV